jgi:hypothetical protein
MTVICIHLFEQDNRFTKLSDGTWESGYWALSGKTAKQLIGGTILFHKKQLEPSFFGGTVLGYRVQDEGEYRGRIVFRFQYSPDQRNVKTEKAGWRNEMKIVTSD